jgi:WD40 repeat protein
MSTQITTLPFCLTHQIENILYAAVVYGPHVKIFNARTGNIVFNHVNKSNTIHQKTKKKNKEEDELDQETFDANIVRAAFHNHLFAAAGNDKTVLVWDFLKGKLLAKCTMKKKVSCIAFSINGTELWFADKFGDAYSVDVGKILSHNQEAELDIETPQLRLGHISLMTDMFMTKDGNYVVTSDRDEKIRVSHYPNVYNIQSYLLGHKEAVSKIAQLDDDHLISGSVDHSLCVWKFKQDENQVVQRIDLIDKVPMSIATFTYNNTSIIAVVNERQSIVNLYTFDCTLKLYQVIDLCTEVYHVHFSVGSNGPLLWILTGTKNHIRVYTWNTGKEINEIQENIALQVMNDHITMSVAPNDEMYPSHIRHEVRNKESREKIEEEKPKGKRARKRAKREQQEKI